MKVSRGWHGALEIIRNDEDNLNFKCQQLASRHTMASEMSKRKRTFRLGMMASLQGPHSFQGLYAF